MKHNRIDILVNNVGQSKPGSSLTMTSSTWRLQITLSLDSAYYAMQAVLPYMVAARCGSIISISSIAGQRYIGKLQVDYSAAKAGLTHLIKRTVVIHAKDNVRLIFVVLTVINTPMLKSVADKNASGDLHGFIAQRNQMVAMR